MKADLYIATRSDRPDIVKVGRSCNVTKRCATLSASQCFNVHPAHVYPGCGEYEKAVHEALGRHRVQGGRGIEWFGVSASEARDIVDAILPNKREAERPSYGYALMMAELGMGAYPSEPSWSKPRRNCRYVCTNSYRPPRTSAEVLHEICLGDD